MKHKSLLRTVVWAALLSLGTGTAAQAGGFTRGTAETDILFDPGNFNMRAGARVVVPSQEFSVNPNPALVGEQVYETYIVPGAAVKFNITDNLRCAGTWTQNTGTDQSYGSPDFRTGELSEEFTTDEFGVTCAVRFAVGPGFLWVIGGGFAEEFSYERVSFLSPGATANLELEGEEYGWRGGLAYEIPEYRLLAQVLYRSGTDYGATGTVTVPGALVGASLPLVTLPANGSGSLPQIVELTLRSGIPPELLGPGMFAFGSVRWTDWSVLETLTVTTPVRTEVDQYQWRDGWTITGGMGRRFNEQFRGQVGLRWDRGVSTGFDLRADVWTALVGGTLIDDIGTPEDEHSNEFWFDVGLSYISDVEETKYGIFNRAADSGYAVSIFGGYRLNW